MGDAAKEEYNSIPIFYCKQCLSLRIMDIPNIENSDYCDDCGNTDVGQCGIEEWESMYESKYGIKYINK